MCQHIHTVLETRGRVSFSPGFGPDDTLEEVEYCLDCDTDLTGNSPRPVEQESSVFDPSLSDFMPF